MTHPIHIPVRDLAQALADDFGQESLEPVTIRNPEAEEALTESLNDRWAGWMMELRAKGTTICS